MRGTFGLDSVMDAANVLDGAGRKVQLLAMCGLELQSAYYGLPGVGDAADSSDHDDIDPYIAAKEKLTQHFSPKHHDSFERFLFWSLAPEDDEPIEKFVLRVQQKAEKIFFGKTETESRHIAIIDKIIQYTSDDFRQKLLEKETLDDTTKIVNAYQAVRYQAARITHKGVEHSVNRLMFSSTGAERKHRCQRCRFNQHRKGERCPAVHRTCLRCGRVGHFHTVCHSALSSGSVSTNIVLSFHLIVIFQILNI